MPLKGATTVKSKPLGRDPKPRDVKQEPSCFITQLAPQLLYEQSGTQNKVQWRIFRTNESTGAHGSHGG